MGEIEEMTEAVTTMKNGLEAQADNLERIDTKCDEIRQYIEDLGANGATVEQLRALKVLVLEAKTIADATQSKTEAVLAEVDALDERPIIVP